MFKAKTSVKSVMVASDNFMSTMGHPQIWCYEELWLDSADAHLEPLG